MTFSFCEPSRAKLEPDSGEYKGIWGINLLKHTGKGYY